MRTILFFGVFLLPQIFWPGFADSFYEIKRVAFAIVIGSAVFLIPVQSWSPPRRLAIAVAAVFGFKALWSGVFHPTDLTAASVLFDFTFPLTFLLMAHLFTTRPESQHLFSRVGAWTALYFALATVAQMIWIPFVDRTALTFGNVNMLAQFIVLLLPFALNHGAFSEKLGRAPRWLFIALIVVALILLRSRSAIISSALCLGVWITGSLSVRQFLKNHKKGIVGGAMGVLVLSFLFFLNFGSQFFASKPSSDQYRLQLARATVSLIKDEPLGVGVGQFEFSLTPYREVRDPGVLDRNPHNEFLKWPAENGWLFAVVAALMLSLLLRRLAVGWFEGQPEARFAAAFTVVVLGESALQFPFENPSSSFLIATTLAWYGSRTETARFQFPSLPLRPIGLGVLVVGLGMFSSHWFESFGDPFDSARGEELCRIEPSQWHLCQDAITDAVAREEWARVEELARNELWRRPLNYYSLLALSQARINQGDFDHGCDLAGRYAFFFPGDEISRGLRETCMAQGFSEQRFSRPFTIGDYHRTLSAH